MPKNKSYPEQANTEDSQNPVSKTGQKDSWQQADPSFPVVGLGASAGGLEALKAFFSRVPEDSGMAYIVVMHMSAKQPSMLPDLLQKKTSIPVATAADEQVIRPDRVYVMPSDKEISIYKGTIQLMDITHGPGSHHPIDLFLRSLAQDQGNLAAAIILSGTGTDGTSGIKEIKSHDGLVMVQSEETAGYDGMPRSAISTRLTDIILEPGEMPEKLIQYFTHAHRLKQGYKPETTAGPTQKQREWLNKIFAVLRTHSGHDFSGYKMSTISRRINRRMGVNQIESYEKYLRYMRENSSEVDALFRELLIGVTSFFREPQSFEVLKDKVLSEQLQGTQGKNTFRAWVPGCSTGEEAYSLAILLYEYLDTHSESIEIQLFGTDIDEQAIKKAREGLFPASIANDVSQRRLENYFQQEGDYYRISKKIRDCVVFSVQDLLKDPPFLHLNLLCCRNVLIYMETALQKKLLPLFHYALNPGGILMLGSSESIVGFSKLFDTVDNKWKIFKKRDVPQTLRQIVDFPTGPGISEIQKSQPSQPALKKSNIGQLTRSALLNQFTPTAILIDDKGEILYVHGRTGKYLETPSGPPTQNILDLARQGLRIELSSALRAAKNSQDRVIRKGLSVKTNGQTQSIDLQVCPQNDPQEMSGKFLVVFEDAKDRTRDSGAQEAPAKGAEQESLRIAELEKELQNTRENHQSTIEELESSNEELKSTNEELQSANEELQSTNEELESSREELQSLNEELNTVNSELQSKVEELSAAHDDMRNLLNSTEIATIFVDNELRIRRFTPEASTLINLIQSDLGRPLQHVASNLRYQGMIKDLQEVLTRFSPKEVEVQTTEGVWYNMRILPYRTIDNRIDGAVLTFTYIDEQKKIQEQLRAANQSIKQTWELVRAIFDMNSDPMLVLNEHGQLVIANTAFAEFTNLSQKDMQDKDIWSLLSGIPQDINLQSSLQNALQESQDFRTRPFELDSWSGKQSYVISARIVKKQADFPYRILLKFQRQ